MDVTIDPQLKGYVDESLAQGTYSSVHEMVNRALFLLQNRINK